MDTTTNGEVRLVNTPPDKGASLSQLDLPARIVNLLTQGGISETGELTRRLEADPDSILAIDGIGPQSMISIIKALESVKVEPPEYQETNSSLEEQLEPEMKNKKKDEKVKMEAKKKKTMAKDKKTDKKKAKKKIDVEKEKKLKAKAKDKKKKKAKKEGKKKEAKKSKKKDTKKKKGKKK